MNTILIIIGVLAVAIGIVIYLQKTGKIEDKDGDLIPDSIEDTAAKVKEVTKQVKVRANNIAKESKEVVAAVKKVAKESKDVIDAVKGTSKGKRKPSTKK
jgi:methyl-accepting chemotaxis protein